MQGATFARLKQSAIGAGFGFFRATGVHRIATRWTGGLGAILMFHRVRPAENRGFAPNGLLEITPDFLAQTLGALRDQDFDIVTLDEALERTIRGDGGRRFAALTFDDGYRDNLQYALPALRAAGAPFTLYVTPGFADRTAGIWWMELEEAVRALSRLEVGIAGRSFSLSASNDSEKMDSFNTLYWFLRTLPEAEMRSGIRNLAEVAGVDWRQIVEDACMDWQELAQMAADPLCTIGAHTMTHPMLANLDEQAMRREMADSVASIARALGRNPTHFAYPVGDPGSAGPREFSAARELGFATAVTTRPGMVFAEHSGHPTALPRLSVNGAWQSRTMLDVLLSGAPFAIWNRGRKVNTG